ncbi:hypothetical protein KJ608_03505 [Patescibacteria group bacterium]|nr:hypothetical protein [Patescibacteria group bacterium]
MSEQTDKLIGLLNKFDLSDEESRIYLYLLGAGASTALKISKETHLGRTKVYRLLDNLYEKKLVDQTLGSRGIIFEAGSPEKLHLLLLERRSVITELEGLLPYLVNELENVVPVESGEGKVLYFKGGDGLKQVTWNSLRAERELLIYEMVTDMSAFLDQSFAEEIREEIVKRRIKVKQITNLERIPPYTDVTEKVRKYWEPRYIDPKVLRLSYEVLIYNDVVAMYNVRGKDFFCIEIHDKNLAKMQRQLFKFVWQSAKKMTIVNDRGEAVLPGV